MQRDYERCSRCGGILPPEQRFGWREPVSQSDRYMGVWIGIIGSSVVWGIVLAALV